MDKYENLGLVGEGSYGVVMKCRHKESRELVAIKKFLESEDDRTVRKIALREIKLLKLLRHDNLVKILEVFRRKKRLYLVFEFIDRTVLDDLERYPRGLDETYAKKILFQVIRGIEFCHQKDIIHRDVKPENILVTKDGIVKVCDFGFARVTAGPGDNLTDYVATRWYRAPELIVGDCNYGKPVDVWAMGCLYSEMLNGDPLFPGDSDIDQLHHIIKCLGNLPSRYEDIFRHNPIFRGARFPEVKSYDPFDRRYPRLSKYSRSFVKLCLQLDANDRPTCSQLLDNDLFQREGFASRFLVELQMKLHRDDVNRSPNIHRKAPSRDQSPAKSKPKIPGRAAELKKEESSISFSLPNPQTGATRGLAVELERAVSRSPAPVLPTKSETEPAVSPVPPPPAPPHQYEAKEDAMDTTRSSMDEEPSVSQIVKKQPKNSETPIPMPLIAASSTNTHQTHPTDERSSPVHMSTMTPAFPSSPTPQNYNTGPPPLKLTLKRSSFGPSTSPKLLTPLTSSASCHNTPPRFLPLIRSLDNSSGLSKSLPLNKPPGHTPSGKPKKGVHLLPYPSAMSHVTHLESLTQISGRPDSSVDDESRRRMEP